MPKFKIKTEDLARLTDKMETRSSKIMNHFVRLKTYLGSFFYNDFCAKDNLIDVLITPVMWIVDHGTGNLGPAFVALCSFAIGCIIIISYWIGLPYWWEKSPITTIFLLTIGNWLLVNCVFHYYMGVTVEPGYPPKGMNIEEGVGVCKKCIAPKPHRAHHCSVCNLCILQMDHHCPWMNNCIGHNNRRYFFLFMAYIVVSIIFLIIFGTEIAYKELIVDEDLHGYPVRVINEHAPVHEWVLEPSEDGVYISDLEDRFPFRKKAILFATLICLGVLVALVILLVRHARMIGRGETSIEMYINDSETKKHEKAKKVYKNPYNLGVRANWESFLGINFNSGRTWFHVLFPSRHRPFGNGLVWPTIHSWKADWEKIYNAYYPKSNKNDSKNNKNK